MENNKPEQAYLEQLHRLYYNLTHRILPDIILSDHVDRLLQPNPAGEGLLREVGTTKPADSTDSVTTETELEKHIAEQEEKRVEREDFNFEDELAEFFLDLEREEKDVPDEFAYEDSAFNLDEDDDATNMYEDDLIHGEDEEEELSEEMQKFMAELDDMLELHNVRSHSSNPDEAFLEDTWREAWFNTTLEQIPERAGYTMMRLNKQGHEIVLFTFPEPFQIPDTWMAAAVRKPGGPYSYYTLECTIGEEETAVLAEWRKGGLHRNSGRRTTDVKNIENFLQMVLNDLK